MSDFYISAVKHKSPSMTPSSLTGFLILVIVLSALIFLALTSRQNTLEVV